MRYCCWKDLIAEHCPLQSLLKELKPTFVPEIQIYRKSHSLHPQTTNPPFPSMCFCSCKSFVFSVFFTSPPPTSWLTIADNSPASSTPLLSQQHPPRDQERDFGFGPCQRTTWRHQQPSSRLHSPNQAQMGTHRTFGPRQPKILSPSVN